MLTFCYVLFAQGFHGFFCTYLFRKCFKGKVTLKWSRVKKIDGIFQENIMGAVCRVRGFRKSNGKIRLERKMKISICMYVRAEVLERFVFEEKSERV